MVWSYLPDHPMKGDEKDDEKRREEEGTRKESCRRVFAVHLRNNKSAIVRSPNDDDFQAGPV